MLIPMTAWSNHNGRKPTASGIPIATMSLSLFTWGEFSRSIKNNEVPYNVPRKRTLILRVDQFHLVDIQGNSSIKVCQGNGHKVQIPSTTKGGDGRMFQGGSSGESQKREKRKKVMGVGYSYNVAIIFIPFIIISWSPSLNSLSPQYGPLINNIHYSPHNYIWIMHSPYTDVLNLRVSLNF